MKNKTIAARVLFKGKQKPENPSWVSAEIEGDRLVFSFPNQDPAQVVAANQNSVKATDPNAEGSEPPIDINSIFEPPVNPDQVQRPGQNDAAAQAATQAASAENNDNKQARKLPSLSSAAAKFASALLVVVGLIFLTAWMAKRLNLRDRLAGSEPGVVRVVGTAMLGLKKQVAVIDVAGQFWVVGLGPSEISLLGKVDDPKAVESLTNYRSRNRAAQTAAAQPEPKQKARIEPTVAPEEPSVKETVKAMPASAAAESQFSSLLNLKQQEESQPEITADDQAEQLETIRSIKQRLQNLKRL
jgi:flagellar biogenesis protein FliO